MPNQAKRSRSGRPELRIRIRSVRRDQPDIGKLSRAVIGLALAQAEAQAKAAHEADQDGLHPEPPAGAGGSHAQ